MNVEDIRNIFINMYVNGEFVTDKTGVKTIEILGPSFIADKDVIFGNLNEDYAFMELKWYLSESLNVYDLDKVPKIWKDVSDKNGFINSNYGWCIFSKDNYHQYKNVLRELKKNKYSRRAIMIYTRPSMHYDYNKNGMSDFICTNNVQVFIRDNKLIYLINQRSMDAIFGYKNDHFWHVYIHNKLLNDLLYEYPDLKKGDMIHQVGSLHIYERHFKFIKEVI